MSRASISRAAGASLAIVILFTGARASAQIAVSGTVTWDVVVPVAGTATFFGASGGAFVQVPIEIGPSGFSGTYSTSLPPDDYYVSASIGDCADAGNGNSFLCTDYLQISKSGTVTVPAGAASFEIDLAPPAGFGQATATGTATLSGAAVVGRKATFGYYLSDNFGSLFGVSNVPIDGTGHYAALVGSGSVYVSAEVLQASCVISQFLFAFASDPVPAGGQVELDTSGEALPPAPPPGRILASFGVVGFPDALVGILPATGLGNRQQDCGGGWNDPMAGDTFGNGIPAGTFLLHDSFDPQATDISVGTYDLVGAFTSNPGLGALTYNYDDRQVTVSSGQTATADFTLNPALIRGTVQVDWSQFGPLAPDIPFQSQSSVVFNAYAVPPPGASQGASARWMQLDGITGIHGYDFVLPMDPARQWTFPGATFTLFYQDGTFANITVTPGVSSTDQVAYVPATPAGQTVRYDFSSLLAFGVGHIQFAPRSPAAVAVGLDGNSTDVVPNQGVRAQYLHIFEFGSPSVTATTMQGQQTLTGNWYDASFNFYSVDLTLDVRPNETVILTESAPQLANLQPLPGSVFCGKQRITASGTVADPDGVSKVLVNGTSVAINRKDGSFSAATEAPLGDSVLTVQAVDRLGNSITRQRPVHRDANCP